MAVALLLVAIFLAGCGTEDREAHGRRVAEGYLQAVKANDLDGAITYFAPGYLETRNPQVLKQDIQIITARLGDLRSYRLTAARSRTGFVPPETGAFVSLQYEVHYARHAAEERFTIQKPFGRGEYKIVGHSIVSEGFARE
ncbi:MAG: hypothetical protein HY726_22410 [Candidatus Rokubacteria bacterium]|nr:hypothetical protein [Candidatus Rokubacteria bacterium]